MSNATAQYREESDHFGEFIEDCCIFEPSATVTSGELWKAYQDWVRENEEVQLSRQNFVQRLRNRKLKDGRQGHGGTRIWNGICLRSSKSDHAAVSANEGVTW